MSYATRTGAGGRLFRWLIGALVLVSAAAQFALVPVMPVYARRFGLSGFEQGLVLGATGLATLVVSMPAGTISDRFGPRRVTLAAGLLMAAATAAQALASGFGTLLAARLAFGAGYGMVWTAGLCWLAGAVAGGPPALGGSVASAGIGGVAGPAAAGALAQHVGLGVPLLITAAALAVITAGLAALRVPAGPAMPRAGKALGLRAVAMNRDLIGAAAAVVVAGLSTGVCALLVPALLHAAGASAEQIGLDFAVSGIMFAIGSALVAAAGRKAVNLPVACGGMLVLAVALTPAVLGAAPLPLFVMLCVTTAARAVLWTVSYPLAAGQGNASYSQPGQGNAGYGHPGQGGAGQGDSGLGASIGLLNLIWAATAVLGPLAAGLAAGHLGAGTAFGLTQAACAAALAVTVAMTWRARRRAHPAPQPQAPSRPGPEPVRLAE
ncbi:MAG TPA: MFS transporter [Streptosporangiaceae bacterium]|nr:MFS transporter [Streptosporangiaceae bacterium]